MEALHSLRALPPGHERVANERVRLLWQRLHGHGLHEALLGVLRQLQRTPEAVRLLEDARQRGLSLNRYHYTSIVALCVEMKNIITIFLFTFVLLACQNKKVVEHTNHSVASTETTQVDTIKKSIPKEEYAMIGKARFTISYHAPAVRGRTIWGGLVPYDEVWVTGAHRATSLEVNQVISLAGNKIPAGKYALFTIPGKESWTVIINKKWNQHLTDEYDTNDDVVRFSVAPESLASVQERLSFSVKTLSDTKGSLEFMWEKIRINIPILTN